MKKGNTSKSIILWLIIGIIVVASVTLTSHRRAEGASVTPVENVVNDSMSFVDRTLAVPGNFFGGIFTTLENLRNTYEQNMQLRQKLDSYNEAVITIKNQQNEIAQLKQELNLNSTLTGFERITANVITRSPDTWQDILIVDRGSADGVAVNMPVMSSQGLIGRVIQVFTHSAQVELLTSSEQGNRFPARIGTGGTGTNSFGILSGYNEETHTFTVSQVAGDNPIQVGDIVQTSGLGGLSPANLLIGTVESIEPNRQGLDREVTVKPAAQLYDISFVTIIQREIEG